MDLIHVYIIDVHVEVHISHIKKYLIEIYSDKHTNPIHTMCSKNSDLLNIVACSA